MVNDVRRAYFYAPAKRDLCIEVPDEDPDKDHTMVGKLNPSLYGKRNAASHLQETLAAQQERIGFTRGGGYTCVVYDPQRLIWTLVHGDDYVSSCIIDHLTFLEVKLSEA